LVPEVRAASSSSIRGRVRIILYGRRPIERR
jgi:hypothetical protein